jgi:hypothetical protein
MRRAVWSQLAAERLGGGEHDGVHLALDIGSLLHGAAASQAQVA